MLPETLSCSGSDHGSISHEACLGLVSKTLTTVDQLTRAAIAIPSSQPKVFRMNTLAYTLMQTKIRGTMVAVHMTAMSLPESSRARYSADSGVAEVVAISRSSDCVSGSDYVRPSNMDDITTGRRLSKRKAQDRLINSCNPHHTYD